MSAIRLSMSACVSPDLSFSLTLFLEMCPGYFLGAFTVCKIHLLSKVELCHIAHIMWDLAVCGGNPSLSVAMFCAQRERDLLISWFNQFISNYFIRN